jgi:cell division protein FtsB
LQTKAFRDNIEKDIASEKKKNTELVKREKQLKSQIDNLIADSLALLKRRLDELGIQVSKTFFFIHVVVSNSCSQAFYSYG